MLKHAVIGFAALVCLSSPLAASARGRLVIDDNDRVPLPRSVHPHARPQFDRGASPASLPLERMILSLRIPAERQARLEQLLHEQQDPASPNYHRWLTPDEFGRQFGPDPADVAEVADWLASHGFRVAERGKGGTWLNFSGTAADVKRAFRTEMHDYEVNGRRHHANATPPEIPRGFAGLVSGVVTLHNFPRTSMLKRAAAAPDGGTLPAYTSGSGSHTLAPGDFAAIYNLNPLYQAGIDGSGQTIAIVGRTHPSSTNWSTFRTSFGLPANPPQVVVNGTDPGDQGAGENGEADLDVEWSGAVARNATVLYVTSKSTYSTDGVDLSAQYIVDHNLAPVMSTSFGSCEAQMGSSENQFYSNLWQQAAAQGITSLVSTGDSGAAGCDDPNASSGSGPAVNGLASTPYNVAVGGSQFSEASGSYWSAGNLADGTSALGYIPEQAWNESAGQPGGSGLWSTGGGASAIYGKPSWQSAVGVPGDGRRDIPDVSLSAALHDGYRVMTQGSWAVFGGTSASSPSFAGIMALVVQKTGQRQGNANLRLYQLASSQYGSGGAPVFHDVTAGGNGVPGVAGNACTTAYDLATGLGSVDASALVANWSGPAAPDFSLAAAQGWLAPPPGGTAATVLTVTLSGGFSHDLALGTQGLPQGVSASFSPATLAAPGSGSSTLTLAASAVVPSGSYPVTVTLSGGGATHSIQLTLLVRNPGDALFYDGFESGDFSGWTVEAGSYLRSVDADTPAAGSYSFTQTGGDSATPRNGISHTLAPITPSTIGFYARSSTTAAASAYFVIGDDNINTNRGVIFFAFSAGNLAVYDGTSWRLGRPYQANTWYFIEFRNIDWVTKTYDFYANGSLQVAGVPFRSQSTVSLTRLHLYNMGYSQAWYDDIFIGKPVAPTVSAAFPADGADGAAVSATVGATFSRAMNPGTISGASFTLTGPADNAVPGTVSYDQASATATFTPSAPLAYGTSYTASIGTAARDIAGNPLAAAVTWHFSTLSPPGNLSVQIAGSGTVNSSPSGIACAGGTSGTCTAPFTYGTTVTLIPAASSGYRFDSWSGCTSISDGNCLVLVTGDRTAGAAFISLPPVRIPGLGSYASLQEAYHAGGASCTIQAQEADLPGDWRLNEGKTVLLEGGLSGDFLGILGVTTINGVLTVQTGTLRAKNLAIR